ncbi:MAG TPA: hypothetical protein PLU49_14360 [Saprospiraceae bacterium]|nr:hypothetical protein [Saprospiraceae bacterium]
MKKSNAENPFTNKSNPKEAELKLSLNRMKMIALLLAAVVLVGIAAVFFNKFSKNSDKSEISDASMERLNQPAAPSQQLQINGNQEGDQMNPGAMGGAGNAAASAGTTAPGMNPPHGQPGHKCEIPVGSPLDGSGSVSAKPKTAPLNNMATTPPTEGADEGVMKNPPHGQPGHRCDIPVGSPLK